MERTNVNVLVPKGRKEFCDYAGDLCGFLTEVDGINKAQARLDFERACGYQACCLHEFGKHQVYSTRVVRQTSG